MTDYADPHRDQPVYTAGTSLDEADGAMIMIHGRGATAQSILTLAQEFDHSQIAYLAPQADSHSWYPHSFLAPVEQNEPNLSSALSVLATLLSKLDAAGIPAARTVLLGFSQGACLASEYVARNPRRYGGLAALSGGLIGRAGRDGGEASNVFRYEGSLRGTPIFLGCSDIDPHIPRKRVEKSATLFRQLKGQVTLSLYPGMPHTVNRDEIEQVRTLLSQMRRPHE